MSLAYCRSPPPCSQSEGACSVVWWYLRGASSSNRIGGSEVKGAGWAGVLWGNVYLSPALGSGVGGEDARWVSVTSR